MLDNLNEQFGSGVMSPRHGGKIKELDEIYNVLNGLLSWMELERQYNETRFMLKNHEEIQKLQDLKI